MDPPYKIQFTQKSPGLMKIFAFAIPPIPDQIILKWPGLVAF